jgi:hypothetical protein
MFSDQVQNASFSHHTRMHAAPNWASPTGAATNRTRLRPFDDQGNILALLKLPDELMRQARQHRNLQRGAVRAQLTVAIIQRQLIRRPPG